MDHASPSLQTWRDLYEAAIAFRDIKAWEWMWDVDTFAVQDPKTGEIGYCAVMGRLGEFYGIAVYPGTEGLMSLLMMKFGQVDPNDTDFDLRMRFLMASFESRKSLQKPDLEIIKELGLSFRGAHQWPVFRSCLPGYHPWYLSESEAKYLTLVLQQAREVCLRLKDNPDLLIPPQNGLYLVRVPEEKEGGELVWKDVWLPPKALRVEPEPPVVVDEAPLERVKKATMPSTAKWEFDVFYSPVPVRDKSGGRPYYPYMCLGVDHSSGRIVCVRMSGHSNYRQEILEELLAAMVKAGVRPRQIWVKNDKAFNLLRYVAPKLGITLKRVPKLGKLEQAKSWVTERLER